MKITSAANDIIPSIYAKFFLILKSNFCTLSWACCSRPIRITLLIMDICITVLCCLGLYDVYYTVQGRWYTGEAKLVFMGFFEFKHSLCSF